MNAPTPTSAKWPRLDLPGPADEHREGHADQGVDEDQRQLEPVAGAVEVRQERRDHAERQASRRREARRWRRDEEAVGDRAAAPGAAGARRTPASRLRRPRVMTLGPHDEDDEDGREEHEGRVGAAARSTCCAICSTRPRPEPAEARGRHGDEAADGGGAERPQQEVGPELGGVEAGLRRRQQHGGHRARGRRRCPT